MYVNTILHLKSNKNEFIHINNYTISSPTRGVHIKLLTCMAPFSHWTGHCLQISRLNLLAAPWYKYLPHAAAIGIQNPNAGTWRDTLVQAVSDSSACKPADRQLAQITTKSPKVSRLNMLKSCCLSKPSWLPRPIFPSETQRVQDGHMTSWIPLFGRCVTKNAGLF